MIITQQLCTNRLSGFIKSRFTKTTLTLRITTFFKIFSVSVAWGCRYKIPQTGGLINGNLSHSSRGWTSKTRVSADLVSGKTLFLAHRCVTLLAVSLLGLSWLHRAGGGHPEEEGEHSDVSSYKHNNPNI